MNDYYGIEMLGRLKMQDLQREVALAALAAQARRSRPGYRAQLAASLRGFARRVDSSADPSLRVSPLTALHQR